MALPVGMVDAKLMPLIGHPVTPAASGGGGDVITAPDPKTQLVQFCQRYSEKPVGKGDIEYSHFKYEGGFQAKVKVKCVDNREFVGEIASNARDAEKAAAVQAMLGYKNEVEQVNAKADGKNKRKLAIPTLEITPVAKVARLAGAASEAAKAPATAKGDLNCTVSRIIRRIMGKQDILYNTFQVPGGFQSRLSIPCLGGLWARDSFVGEISYKKMDAEQSVAAVALVAIQKDAQLMNKAAQPSAKMKAAAAGLTPNYAAKGSQMNNALKGQGKAGGKGSPSQGKASTGALPGWVGGQQNVWAQAAQTAAMAWDQSWNPQMQMANQLSGGQFNVQGFSSW